MQSTNYAIYAFTKALGIPSSDGPASATWHLGNSTVSVTVHGVVKVWLSEWSNGKRERYLHPSTVAEVHAAIEAAERCLVDGVVEELVAD